MLIRKLWQGWLSWLSIISKRILKLKCLTKENIYSQTRRLTRKVQQLFKCYFWSAQNSGLSYSPYKMTTKLHLTLLSSLWHCNRRKSCSHHNVVVTLWPMQAWLKNPDCPVNILMDLNLRHRMLNKEIRVRRNQIKAVANN